MSIEHGLGVSSVPKRCQRARLREHAASVLASVGFVR